MINNQQTSTKYKYSPEQLSINSDKPIIYTCDFCNTVHEKTYSKYNKGRTTVQKDCCSSKSCINQKRNLVWQKKYTEGHPNKNSSIQEKRKKTVLKKYGVDNVAKANISKQNTIKTNLIRYGTTHPSQNEKTKQKKNITNLERYGVEHVLQNKTIHKRSVETHKNRTGYLHPMYNPKTKQKIKNYTKEKYGCDHLSQIHISPESLNKLQNKEWLYDQHVVQKKCLTQISTELGLSATSKTISDYCKRHDIEIQKTIVSIAEKEIYEYIKSLGFNDVEMSNRSAISPKELDIYIPSKNIAIEYCGLYWHSDIYKDRKYHVNKMKACNDKGIRLITIFEDEWKNKSEIVKNRLSHILHTSNNKTYARKCTIAKGNYKDFVEKYHIQGHCNSNLQYGLFDDQNTLIAVMTFKKPRFNSSNPCDYELLRYCTIDSLNVVGGAGKLFSAFLKEYSPSSVISYCDLRWGTGKLYECLGFMKSHVSKESYYYVKNNKRYNRMKYTKNNLKKTDGFDQNISERENMERLDFSRIYDCGTNVYIYNNKKENNA